MYSYHSRSRRILGFLSATRPSGVAQLCGGTDCPDICGTVMVYQSHAGVFFIVSLKGIPEISGKSFCFGVKDKNGGSTVTAEIFADGRSAWSAFLAESLDASDVIGKCAFVGSDSGKKLACGEIHRNIVF